MPYFHWHPDRHSIRGARLEAAEAKLFSRQKICHCKQLESLTELLIHACKVIQLGQSFLRWLLDLHATGSRPDGKSMNRVCQSDIAQWGSCRVMK